MIALKCSMFGKKELINGFPSRGLVLYLDALQNKVSGHDMSSDVIEDLMGNFVCTPNETAITQWTENGYNAADLSNTFELNTTKSGVFKPDATTICIHTGVNNSGGYTAIYALYNQSSYISQIVQSYWSTQGLYIAVFKSGPSGGVYVLPETGSGIAAPNKLLVSAVYWGDDVSGATVTSNVVKIGSNSSWAKSIEATNRVYFGANPYRSTNMGKTIHAFLVYNRKIEGEELIKIYNNAKQRFNIQ